MGLCGNTEIQNGDVRMSVSIEVYEAVTEKNFELEQSLKQLESAVTALLIAAGEGSNATAHRAIDLLPRKYVYEAKKACLQARKLVGK